MPLPIRPSAAVLVLVALGGLPGCAAALVAAGAAATYGTVRYINDEAYSDFPVTVDRAWEASVAALAASGYPFGYQLRPGPNEGHIEVDDVKLTVTAEDGGMTRVRVRVGTFETEEHRRRAEEILDRIAKRLV